MIEVEDLPQPDQLEGAPHPRHTALLLGQNQAEARFLEAFNTDRLHHAWLITGPRGVGKATLAWRIARFLLATPKEEAGLFGEPEPATSLDIDPEHPVARRVAALSEPGLFLLRRPWDEKTKKLKQDITVDAARGLKGFFSLSVAGGGRRVVIVDAADQLNPSAANAVLKLLEEPPENTTLLLVCHSPARLLPTIRSRCRSLRCAPLPPPELAQALEQAGIAPPDHPAALAELAAGSVGAAVTLLEQDGLARYAALIKLMDSLPRLNRAAATGFAESTGGKDSGGLAQTLDLMDLFLTRLARTGAAGPPAADAAPDETALLTRLCPDARAARRWATLQQSLSARARTGAAVNLDPSALILDMVLKITAEAQASAP